jgi:hypothetical protein
MPEKRKVFRRNSAVAWRVIDGSAVVVVPATQSMHTLNEVGTFIWQTCDSKTADDIVAEVIREFDVDQKTARADLKAFSTRLAKDGMLKIE